ncbi:MAG: hypothetical protein P4L50_00285 [Anaerolineaceae bacterium]|nr:hypothetical protein [Anaerolineaceae bacterium]
MSDSNQSPPLNNEPAAREPDGTLKDATQALTTQPTQTSTPVPSLEPKTNEPTTTADAKSTDTKPVVPETYTFTDKEGKAIEVDKTILEAATPIFRELGLDNTKAQKLVELWNAQVNAKAVDVQKTIATQREKWTQEVLADPLIGGDLGKVSQNIGRLYDSIGDPAFVREFKQNVMDHGLDNYAPFVKMMIRLADKLTEGTHVSGTGPSVHGQSSKGVQSRPSIAQALYPNNPTNFQ